MIESRPCQLLACLSIQLFIDQFSLGIRSKDLKDSSRIFSLQRNESAVLMLMLRTVFDIVIIRNTNAYNWCLLIYVFDIVITILGI